MTGFLGEGEQSISSEMSVGIDEHSPEPLSKRSAARLSMDASLLSVIDDIGISSSFSGVNNDDDVLNSL